MKMVNLAPGAQATPPPRPGEAPSIRRRWRCGSPRITLGENSLAKIGYKSVIRAPTLKGDKQRRLHKALLCYHDLVNWPLIRQVLEAMEKSI
ncbi:DUF3362 domain-containing protein [Shigella flexneri]